MAALVKVWNDNVHPHTEKFKGKVITIPPKSFVEMDYLDGKDFQGQFVPPKKLGTGADDPTGYKMIRVDEPAQPIVQDDGTRDPATGKVFATAEQAMQFAMAYAAANASNLVSNPDLDKQSKDTVTLPKSELESMMARIQALESQTAKRGGPGRPKKEA